MGWAMLRAADPRAVKHAAGVKALREASVEDLEFMLECAKRTGTSPKAAEVEGWAALADRVQNVILAEQDRRNGVTTKPAARPVPVSSGPELAREASRFKELMAAGLTSDNIVLVMKSEGFNMRTAAEIAEDEESDEPALRVVR